MAIGFLFKSVVVGFAVPAIFLYALFYHNWSWVKSKYLWYGLVIAAIIFIPWHAYETVRYGSQFWENYIGQQVLRRAETTLTGTNGYADYVNLLEQHDKPWDLLAVVEIVVLLALSVWPRFRDRLRPFELAPPLLIAVLIIFVFTLAHTHLPTYILPAIPFLAIFTALALRNLLNLIHNNVAQLLVVGLVMAILGYYSFFSVLSALDQVPMVTFDERSVGIAYRASSTKGPLYAISWPILETLNYYGNTETSYIDPSSSQGQGKSFQPPFYLVVPSVLAQSLIDTASYHHLKVLYAGDYLTLFEGSQYLRLSGANQ